MTVIVKSSSLHGAGVYTTAAIKKGARILEYTGPRLPSKQCEGMYADTEVTYLFAMDDGKTIIDGFGIAAFVNHTCDPNCETDQIDDRIWILALRDIEPGEELTYDYNLFDGEPGEQAPCYCGMKGCRKTMFSEEEVARQKKVLLQRKRRREAAKARRENSGARKRRRR
ncbi:MAG TPA: SET domain-containing protein-lysine N-methyltransferase [Candidatus Angelobacter sp.]|nr:SET domain-containing protein-lysine N-methyltransferase [Candidatus Angelobacter sp.]